MFGLGESFRYGRCRECGSVFIAEVPGDLADYYSSKYYSFDIDPEALMGRPGVSRAVAALGRSTLFGRRLLSRAVRRTVAVRQVRTTLALFESVALAGLSRGHESRVLDVGCGSGALVYALSLAGLHDVAGVDPFVDADRTFDTGARLLRKDLPEVDGVFDLIMLHHSLEHVPSPRSTMREVRQRLAPGGRVLVRMPTVSSAAFERYGSSWMQLDPPRHLTVFSREGMQRLCADLHLHVERVQDDSTSFQFWASEQVQNGIPLVSERSHFVDPRASSFSAARLRGWDQEARALNRAGRGDQAAWVLTASPTEPAP